MTTYNTKDLILRDLANGLPAMTPEFGAVLAQAGAICFEERAHPNGVELLVEGTYSAKCKVFWQNVTDQMRRNWNDLERATEYGAYGVAILLVLNLTGYTVVSTSRKGTGFDFWLGKKDERDQLLFQGKARLEVSGIREGNPTKVRARVKQKLEQVGPSNSTRLPAYIIVVEFNTPLSHMVKNEPN